MELSTRLWEPDVLMKAYEQLLADDSVDTLPLVISGNSMSPFLVHDRDTVYLSRLKNPISKGQMLLYRRFNGQYVLHRVYRVEADSLTMVGDAQTELEPGIRPGQVIAVVTSALRKGKMQTPGCFWWEFFEKVWIRMVPLRPVIRGVYTAFRRLWKG